MIVEDFQENLVTLLKRKGMNQSELARKMGVTPSYVCQLLNGHTEPGIRVLERIANAIGVSACSLIQKKREKVAEPT